MKKQHDVQALARELTVCNLRKLALERKIEQIQRDIDVAEGRISRQLSLMLQRGRSSEVAA